MAESRGANVKWSQGMYGLNQGPEQEKNGGRKGLTPSLDSIMANHEGRTMTPFQSVSHKERGSSIARPGKRGA